MVYWFLMVEEFWEVLSIVFGNCVWNLEEFISDIYVVLVSCGSFVMVDEELLMICIVY